MGPPIKMAESRTLVSLWMARSGLCYFLGVASPGLCHSRGWPVQDFFFWILAQGNLGAARRIEGCATLYFSLLSFRLLSSCIMSCLRSLCLPFFYPPVFSPPGFCLLACSGFFKRLSNLLIFNRPGVAGAVLQG